MRSPRSKPIAPTGKPHSCACCARPRSTSRRRVRSPERSGRRSSPTSRPSTGRSTTRWRASCRAANPSRAVEAAPNPRSLRSPVRSRSTCRGRPAGWSPGQVAAANRHPKATRCCGCSWPRARRSRAGAHTTVSRCRVSAPRPRSRCRSARSWAGSSRPAPIRSATTSVRACAGWAASHVGRSS